MSQQLRDRLTLLEEDYPDQPPSIQKADLSEINALRSELGMPLVDERLREQGVVEQPVEEELPPEPEDAPDHTEARAIYKAYLAKAKELKRYQDYAMRVAEATRGSGMTPVRPLATMGTNGGPLLCDHCKKPILLEGGPHHGKTADVGWRNSSQEDWSSWILGGMVVEIQTNETLRIYHGYPGQRDNQCCNVASRQLAEAMEKHDLSQKTEKRGLLLEFIEYQFPDKSSDEQMELLSKILDLMYSFDPGLGVNHPPK